MVVDNYDVAEVDARLYFCNDIDCFKSEIEKLSSHYNIDI